MPKPRRTQREALDKFLENAAGKDIFNAPLGDLDNPIHPLFKLENWTVHPKEDQKRWTVVTKENRKPGSTSVQATVNAPSATADHQPLSAKAYDAIAPALRLVSLLITEPAMLHPFDHVCNGEVTFDKNGDHYIAPGTFEGTPTGLEYIEQVFLYMAEHTSSRFEEVATLKGNCKFDSTTYPATRVPVELTTIGGQKIVRHINQGSITVRLARPQWLEYLEAQMSQDRPAYQLNTLLIFAWTLTHESMHACASLTLPEELKMRRDSQGRILSLEPRFCLDDTLHELGFCYTKWLWGEEFESVSSGTCERCASGEQSCHRPDHFPIWALRNYQWNGHPSMYLGDDNKGAYYPVVTTIMSTHVVRAWFTKVAWRRIRLYGHRFLIQQAEGLQLELLGQRLNWTDFAGDQGVRLLRKVQPHQTLGFEQTAETGPSSVQQKRKDKKRATKTKSKELTTQGTNPTLKTDSVQRAAKPEKPATARIDISKDAGALAMRL
ncbi:hypothetical protein EK21DRAFT_111580 [Setomelanomma holmii]|uniref:Uncharacterized protein n=1 Tax=Setomelanomma holmii TaxID=210430 RepID=A0A9P4LPC6_9PLEO|nr:hypothetical protein EK21DRAFT_111580 [Setomelanomma holmii]